MTKKYGPQTSELQREGVLELLRGCNVDGRLPVAVDGRGVGSVAQQERANFGSALRGRLVQG